jgi:hypothetical protein
MMLLKPGSPDGGAPKEKSSLWHVFVLDIEVPIQGLAELTIDVFHDVWRRASCYDAANGTVLRWIMNQAGSRAIDRLRFDNRKKRRDGGDLQPLAEVAADPCDMLELREQRVALQAAVAALTPGEREAIGDVLRRAYACRSRGAAKSTARHYQDEHSFRTLQAAAHADNVRLRGRWERPQDVGSVRQAYQRAVRTAWRKV